MPVTFPYVNSSSMRPIIPRLEGFFDRVQKCNTGQHALKTYTKLVVDDVTIGYVRPQLVSEMLDFTDVFKVVQMKQNGSQPTLTLNSNLATLQDRTQAISCVTSKLREKGIVKGWRDELLNVAPSFHAQPKFLIERAAAPHFGIKTHGVHVNGFTENENGETEIWVARRSKNKSTWPGKLDHISAGAMPHGINCQENVEKECCEEANIPEELAKLARPAGAVSCAYLLDDGELKRDVLFVYDLHLPQSFVPTPNDGEVDEFMKLPVWKVAQIVSQSEDYKDNCNLVIVDFLLRHGFLSPDQEGYLELLTSLRLGDCL